MKTQEFGFGYFGFGLGRLGHDRIDRSELRIKKNEIAMTVFATLGNQSNKKSTDSSTIIRKINRPCNARRLLLGLSRRTLMSPEGHALGAAAPPASCCTRSAAGVLLRWSRRRPLGWSRRSLPRGGTSGGRPPPVLRRLAAQAAREEVHRRRLPYGRMRRPHARRRICGPAACWF